MTYLILLPHVPALFMTSLTDCGAQNGRTHCYDFATYKRWSLKTEDEKIVVTEYCSVSIKKKRKKKDFFL